jgi:prolyl oligopeptidase
MNAKLIIILLLPVFSCVLFCNDAFTQKFVYAPTPKQPVADTIFGKVVMDEYRWLEEVSDPKVQHWMKAQAAFSDSVLNSIPGRNVLMEEFKRLGEKTSTNFSIFTFREGGRYFYTKALAGENVAKLYYRNGKDGRDVLLFDTKTYTQNGAPITGFRFTPSKDGKKVALALTEGGKGDINTVKVLNVDTKTFYPDSLYPVHSVQGWTSDNKGFLYAALQTGDHRSNELFKDITINYHRLGTEAKEDEVVLAEKNNPELGLKPSDFLAVLYGLSLSPDNKYLTIALPAGYFYASVADLGKVPIRWNRLGKPEDGIDNGMLYNEMVYFVADGAIKSSPVDEFEVAKASTVIPKSGESIEWVKVSRDYLFVVKTDGVNTSTLQYHLLTGRLDSVQPPYSGTAWILPFDTETNDCYINVTSWLRPRTQYFYNPAIRKMSLSPFNPMVKYPDIEDLMVKVIDVKSHDGVMVPLTLIHNKNIKRDGSNVVLMTGFGAYGTRTFADFNPMFLPLLKRGVIIAKAHVRGGGEKGETWHKGGFKATKPNAWKDFIACAEYLIKAGYTSPKHLVSEGFSAGGITVGRAMTERPELFAATIHNYPLSNPLRGENRPNGAADAVEFGTVKDSTEAMGLLLMDAYLNVKPRVEYPAVLATAGINDPRVPVWQPGKLVAALQNASTSDKPVLLNVNYDSGHGPVDWIRDASNQYAFALWQAGHNHFQTRKKKPL